ncbi:endosomal/lysosomal potassium channel TMEM175-like [Xenia sp. Carnegie-2017]|uniref:endosomal/lysosomal potassium channel TMEM175-like n=1 Tax=Xenia sp. Carnegie-2017 TaxID=2897299 RepID=UPI001F047F88|nr:endosomal/lysosomal potassium channel TMEM175-like [Xenia sp. Carnegie-2017]
MERSNDIYTIGRLQAFSDAVSAIVATILILPLQKVDRSNSSDFEAYLRGHYSLLIIYFIAFLVICSVWEAHIMRWMVICRVDDILVCLNIISLLFVSFLPFAVRLISKYTYHKTPFVLVCGIMLVLEVIELLMIWYSFTRHELLRARLRNAYPFEIELKKNYIMKRKILNPVLFILAGALSFVNVKISWVLILLVIITPCINRLLDMIIYRSTLDPEEQRVLIYEYIISKERVECFTDGVYSIVATFLVLDISSDHFPSKEDVAAHGVEKTLSTMKSEFLTYVGTFGLCGLLWFVHHSLFHNLEKMSYPMVIMNNISLSCVGTLPFLVTILNSYAEDENKCDRYAIQFCCLIIAVAGFSQFVIFTLGLCNSSRYIDYHVIPCGPQNINHNYLLIKLLIIPTVATVIFCASFASKFDSYITYHVLVFVTPLIFIFVKFLYVKLVNNRRETMTIIRNEALWNNR